MFNTFWKSLTRLLFLLLLFVCGPHKLTFLSGEHDSGNKEKAEVHENQVHLLNKRH